MLKETKKTFKECSLEKFKLKKLQYKVLKRITGNFSSISVAQDHHETLRLKALENSSKQ